MYIRLHFTPDCTLPAMRATLCVQTLLGQPQSFHRPSTHQVLLHNLCRIRRLHIPIPDPLRINHHCGSVLTLVQAPCLVNPHLRPQPRGFGKLIQLRMQLAFPIRTARRPRRIHRPHIMTNKNVALKPRQRHSSKIAIHSSLPCSLIPVFPHPTRPRLRE